MKRIAMFVLCAAALCLPLTGCKGKEPDKEGEPKAGNIVFTGTVEEVGEDFILVSTTDDVGFTRASVSFGEALEAVPRDFKIGQVWRITILPEIRESDPVQVTAVALETAAKEEEEPEAENIVFTGTIEEVGENFIIVNTVDDVGFTRASVSFDTAMEAPLHDFKIGQQWLITILPVIRESYPVQVTAVALEILYDTMPVPKNNA